jgi:hypothetical protein
MYAQHCQFKRNYTIQIVHIFRLLIVLDSHHLSAAPIYRNVGGCVRIRQKSMQPQLRPSWSQVDS